MKPSVKGQPKIRRKVSGEVKNMRQGKKMAMGKAGATTVSPMQTVARKGY